MTKIRDVNNNTPQVQIPAIWKIMAGCPDQTLDLNPIDLDNDKIRFIFNKKFKKFSLQCHTMKFRLN